MKLSNLLSRGRQALPKTVRDDDVFIVSYPRSGNTWQRFLVANLLRPQEEVTFESIDQIIPDVHQKSDEDLAKAPSPRILKSHEAFTARYPKTIYITRDPRSVAISAYQFMISHGKLAENYPLSDFLAEFVRGEHFRHFRPWGDNVMSWISQADAGNRSILVLRYEDLRASPLAPMRQVAAFLGIEAADAALQQAIERSSFERMQELEKKRANPKRPLDPKRPFVRKGELKEWETLFSEADKRLVSEAFAEPMKRMGYL